MRLVFLFLAFGLPASAGEIDWLSDKPARSAKPDCSCGTTCLCKDGRIDPRCTCENCRCAIVKPAQKDRCPKCGSDDIGGSVDIGILCRCDACGHFFYPPEKKEARASRATIQETSRPRQADTPATGKASKATTQGCVKCGPLCECGPGCQCSETSWKESCKAIPPEHRAAWARYYASQATYYQQPYYQPMYGGFGSTGGNCAGGS